jgi:hypothetical protein
MIMKFKVLKETETYRRLDELLEKINVCNQHSKHLVESWGFKEFGISMKGVGGGLSCIYSRTKPEGFKTVGKPSQNLIMPKANQKALWCKIQELPIVTREEFNNVIGYKEHFKGLIHHRCYGLKKRNDLFLIDTGNSDYIPTNDLIEILESEYKLLDSKK